MPNTAPQTVKHIGSEVWHMRYGQASREKGSWALYTDHLYCDAIDDFYVMIEFCFIPIKEIWGLSAGGHEKRFERNNRTSRGKILVVRTAPSTAP